MADGNLALDRSTDTHGQDDGDSLRSSLMAAFDAPASDNDTITAQEPVADAPQEPEGHDEGTPAADKPEGEAEVEAGAAEEDARSDKGQDEVAAPVTWSKADQEMFKKQPPEAREFLTRRYKEMEAGFTRNAQELAPVRKEIAKWQPYLTQIGARPEEAIDALMRTEYTLRQGTPEQRRDALLKLAQQYKVDIPSPTAQQPQADEPPLDPRVQTLAQQVQQLTGTLTQAQQREQMRAQQEHAQQANKLTADIESFREAKTEAGQPAHPYFDDVQDDMAALVHAHRVNGRPIPSLNDLYEAAVWANPATRQRVQDDQRKADERARNADRMRKARAAQNAGSSLSAAPTGGEGGGDLSLRETLEKLVPGR